MIGMSITQTSSVTHACTASLQETPSITAQCVVTMICVKSVKDRISHTHPITIRTNSLDAFQVLIILHILLVSYTHSSRDH